MTKSPSIRGSDDQKAAWVVGCSEASRSMAYASSQSLANPRGWWLEVETGNSWSSTDLGLNQYTIQGLVDALHRQSPAPVGIYSTDYQWHKIVGPQPVTGARANWVATGSFSVDEAHARCGTGFSGAPVWPVQYLRGGFDTNYVC